MNRDEALKLLRSGQEGIHEWNQRKGVRGELLDLTDANLIRANLTGADLRQAVLRQAVLTGANLIGADLAGADLRHADLTRAGLTEANLTGANLTGANLTGADLTRADLTEADLTEADLYSANLSSTHLEKANLSGASVSWTSFCSDLSEAKNLDEIVHNGHSEVSLNALLSFQDSLPEKFLRGCGVADEDIEYFRSRIGAPIQFYSCFISYSHKDKQFARQLHDRLQSDGIRCWLDEHEIKPGERIHDVVNRAIRVHDKLLLCCSEASLGESTWVDDEIAAATERERKEGRDILIPLNLDGYLFDGWESGRAPRIRERLAADFRNWKRNADKFEREFQKVVKALQASRETAGS